MTGLGVCHIVLTIAIHATGVTFMVSVPHTIRIRLETWDRGCALGGGVMLQPHWQLMGALEAADGMLLFGMSTAFIFTVMQFYYQHLVFLGRSGGSVKAG